jgi:hypothetical protein
VQLRVQVRVAANGAPHALPQKRQSQAASTFRKRTRRFGKHSASQCAAACCHHFVSVALFVSKIPAVISPAWYALTIFSTKASIQ